MKLISKTTFLEVGAIIFAMGVIYLIWAKYPSYMLSMDPVQSKVTVPYKLPDPNEQKQFENIGERFGTYGDSYGSLNTLFSGLAFSVLIISLFLQRNELQLQRKEIAAQRGEIEKSNEIAEQQRTITEQQKHLNEQQVNDAKVQSFYTLLFKFLDEKARKIENLELARASKARGNYVFDYFLQGAIQRIKAAYLYADSIENEPYEELYLIFEDLIQDGHKLSRNTLVENEYFEYICFILRFIEEHENLGIVDTAIKIFVSYQTINEMSCMFLVSLEDEELKGYITKYALLRKFNTYEGDKHLLALVDRTLGEKSYCP